MKYDKNHKPTGDAAKEGKLDKGFEITGAVRSGSTTYAHGDEDAFAASKPSAADVAHLTESGALSVPEQKSPSKS